MSFSAKLIFLCGKMAAGKSTLARELTGRDAAVLLVQDEFLQALFPGEITDVAGYLKYSTRLQDALTPHIGALLRRGLTVVLDFPANTRTQRAWFRKLIDKSGVAHELHYICASDALCKHQLRERSKDLPPGTPWTSEAEFDAITAHFEPPAEEERFHIVRYDRK